MKILVSWSSGKDSAWMVHVLNQQVPGAVAALLTTVNEGVRSAAMHGARTSVLRAQADAAGVPLITASIPSPCSNEVYEQRMRAVVSEAVADGSTRIDVSVGEVAERDGFVSRIWNFTGATEDLPPPAGPAREGQ